MVEVSRLRDLDIYTVQGKYVGRVEDVVLNIRLGTISKLVIRALEPESNRQFGLRGLLRGSFQMVPDEDDMRSFQEGLLTITYDKVAAIGDIMIDLKNGTQQPSLQREDNIIAANANGDIQDAPNFTADCFYETDTDVVAIELKSVRPNSGEMRGEKQKILVGKAVLRALYPNKNVKYIFGFPFDPTSDGDTTYDKARFLHYLVEAEKFVAHEDFLIADELWSFLASSNGAMQEMLDIINRIATPEFMDIYDKIQDEHVDKREKRALLESWYQYSEVAIIDNVRYTTTNCRLYNQPIFKTDGGYNEKRLQLLNQ